MVESLTGLPPSLGPAALLGIAVLLVLTGAIPTRRELRDTRADRDHYREAVDTLHGAVLKQGVTLERLLEYAETANHALEGLQRAAAEEDREQR